MIRRDLSADRNERVVADAEFRDLALRLDLGDGETAALGLARVLHLAGAGTELERDVAVFFLVAMRDDLALRKTQHRDRHMVAGIGKDAGHADLLSDHSGAHIRNPCLSRPRLRA